MIFGVCLEFNGVLRYSYNSLFGFKQYHNMDTMLLVEPDSSSSYVCATAFTFHQLPVTFDTPVDPIM